MYIYTELPDVNIQLSTHGVVYISDNKKGIKFHVDAEFDSGWDQEDSNNAENVMSCTGYVITYAVLSV